MLTVTCDKVCLFICGTCSFIWRFNSIEAHVALHLACKCIMYLYRVLTPKEENVKKCPCFTVTRSQLNECTRYCEYTDHSTNVSVNLRPPEMESQVVNRTVRACCEGWGGPSCSEGENRQHAWIVLILHAKWNPANAMPPDLKYHTLAYRNLENM